MDIVLEASEVWSKGQCSGDVSSVSLCFSYFWLDSSSILPHLPGFRFRTGAVKGRLLALSPFKEGPGKFFCYVASEEHVGCVVCV